MELLELEGAVDSQHLETAAIFVTSCMRDFVVDGSFFIRKTQVSKKYLFNGFLMIHVFHHLLFSVDILVLA